MARKDAPCLCLRMRAEWVFAGRTALSIHKIWSVLGLVRKDMRIGAAVMVMKI